MQDRKLEYVYSAAIAIAIFGASTSAMAQTGVDDDRVSLPAGPGSIEGVGENASINPNMGSMSYGVAIQVPAGVNGLTPEVGLNYSSSGGSSVVGVGWSMPMQSIERMTSRGAPEYDEQDLFAAGGGAELVHVGEDGAGGRRYRERFEGGFIRYTWHDVGDGEEGYWAAETPDGSISYFGADAQGNLVTSARSTKPSGGVYKYHLVERVDPYGNRILYSYDARDGNWPLVDRIDYAFDGDEALYSIEFEYGARQDKISDAGAGYEELLAYRLEGVAVKMRDEVIREYVLSYESYDTSGGFTRLSGVTRYGLGGEASGARYPIAFSFDYSRALGVDCAVDCDSDKPYLVTMGGSGAASGLLQGTATLVDLNADGLPDVVDTTQQGAHAIYLNELTVDDDGTITSQAFGAARSSQHGTGTGFMLGQGIVQTADVNGDGLSDLFNARSGATLIAGYGLTDWAGAGNTLDVSGLSDIDMNAVRFMDYNNDKKIDIISSTSSTTIVYENLGESFAARTVEPIGVSFENNPSVQMADMNGDGYNDVIEIRDGGTLRYRLNLGLGRWGEWSNITSLSVPLSERELVDFEDINGDGLSDVVIVNQTQAKYAINRNGTSFDAFRTITSEDIDGSLPERQLGSKVLYADMNANGSNDVVWFDPAGSVKYLELFPVRPNLLSRIENGIGSVQNITYTTSAIQAAAARQAGSPWDRTLSIPMNIVSEVDTYVTLTGDEDGAGLHDITTYTYRDGFYDGVEKQYRGFQTVEVQVDASASQEGGVTTITYDLGASEPHKNGKMLSQVIRSGDRILREEMMTWETCALDGIAESAQQGRFGVYFPCNTAQKTVIKEGSAQQEWVELLSESEYDGWGNVTSQASWGDVARDGDEMFSETEYYYPQEGSRYFVGLPLVERTWAVEGGSTKTETRTYYDGEDFIGATADVTHGFVSRTTAKADEDTTLETSRQRRDEHGNVVETISANGSLEDEEAHRRLYVYDERGLFLRYVDILIAPGKALRRTTFHDERFQKMTYATDWVLLLDGELASPTNEHRYDYDDFGRLARSWRPGDEEATPTTEYTYELGDPFSRIISSSRTERGGQDLQEQFACYDGRGQLYQKRTKTDAGDYLVTGFSVYNSRGAQVEVFQPYTSPESGCESARPENVLSSQVTFDATFRPLLTTDPGEALYGEPLMTRTEYLPLRELSYEPEDMDPSSPHYNTPTVAWMDGLGRQRAIERYLTAEDAERYEFLWDETGSFAGYIDPRGNRHELVVDLAGRVVAARNETTGTQTFAWDDSGNLIAHTDARGSVRETSYDGAERILEVWDGADRDGTLITYRWDERHERCDLRDCTNTANKLSAITYPSPLGEGVETFGYDSRQRLVYQERALGEIALQTRTTFDNIDRDIARSYNDGTTITTTYDMASRPVKIDGFIDALTYDARGQLATIAYANASSSAMLYDDLMRLESKIARDGADAVIFGLVFERDRLGNVLSRQDVGEQEGFDHGASYTYDAWYRLTESANGEGEDAETITYNFDALDRITQVSSSISESAAHLGQVDYDAARPLAVTTAGAIEFAFDEAGQMTRRGSLAYEWDYMGRPAAASRDGAREEYIWGAKRERVAVLGEDRLVLYGFDDFEVRDGVSAVYVRVANDRVAKSISTELQTEIFGDADGDGVLTSHDTFALGGEDDVMDGPRLGAVAARMLAELDGSRRYFHTDDLGSLLAGTDEGGEVVGQRIFSPTGVTLSAQGYVDTYGFTGQEHDAFTGMIRFKWRDFDPQLGRWISFDPFFARLIASDMDRLGEATSGYAYVGNNFVNNVDPLGLTLKAVGAKIKAFAQSANRGRKQGSKAPTLAPKTQAQKDAEKKAETLQKGRKDELAKLKRLQETHDRGTPITNLLPSLARMNEKMKPMRQANIDSLQRKIDAFDNKQKQAKAERMQQVRQFKTDAKNWKTAKWGMGITAAVVALSVGAVVFEETVGFDSL